MANHEDRPITVGMIADPGVTQAVAARVAPRLRRTLNSGLLSEDDWEVEIEHVSLPLSQAGRVIINEHAPKITEKNGWDYLLYLTDIPQYVQGRPVSMIISTKYRVATIVIPALGLARARTVNAKLLHAIAELHGRLDLQAKKKRDPLSRALSITGSVLDDHEPDDRFSTVDGLPGRILLVLGMIRSNQPWRLIPRLSSAMAGAAATGAFGVFYTSIWMMADYLSNGRLLLITVSSILILSTWLVFHNRLWESPKGARRRERLLIYNTATMITVGLAAAGMYLLLFAVLLLGAIIVIDAEFLAIQLEHHATTREYVNLAWLAASLGTLGGAIGSSFDDVNSVREATFSQREYERRNIDFDDDDEDS